MSYDIVQFHDNRATTTSLVVAEKFGKPHKNVLRDIDNLDTPEEFNRLNFEPITYVDSRGRVMPAVKMTRDGFALLAMGFTGKEALRWKIAFIDAFNASRPKCWNSAGAMWPGKPPTDSGRKSTGSASIRTGR